MDFTASSLQYGSLKMGYLIKASNKNPSAPAKPTMKTTKPRETITV